MIAKIIVVMTPDPLLRMFKYFSAENLMSFTNAKRVACDCSFV
jgi:hypothetical protein